MISAKVQPIRKQVFRRKNYGPEEQIRKLKKRVMVLTGALIVTLALLCAMVYPTVTFFLRNYHLRPGQNYNTVTVTEAAETTEAPLDQ